MFTLPFFFCQAQSQSIQCNLNWLDWDSLITDNYHPPPPGIVRKKGPSWLKFYMQPQLTILTTSQHNFNPTNLWGGGDLLINPTGSFLLLIQKILIKNFFRSKNNFLNPQNFLTPNFFDQKIFSSKKNFWPKKYFDPKIFLTKMIILNQNFFDLFFT